ncbi:protein kinase activating protein dpb11 [Diaporthe australafricana]|uniref:Protein kinase activating protein dpb11 n=1 Tax=Diaporthe australafricana TaxID=127596 RepID=A0ABR3XWH6_9PEZI
MESPPASSDHGDEAFDPSKPFTGVVVCCTSIPTDHRSIIARKTDELGGIHKYDLTPDVTHLIVGEYDTPKYRHVAKERPDIKAMAVGWVDAVRNLWVRDEQIDFPALEKEWCLKAFETGGGAIDNNQDAGPKSTLNCCLSGFEDQNARQRIIDTIQSNGGDYTGDLSRHVTHLIVYKPEGKKYLAARNWGLHVVGLRWVYDCVERGMILDEKLYDPQLPKEDIGKGAWNKRASANRRISLGKRQREAATKQEQGRRKLRKTASMKLNSQRDNMWGEILGQPSVDQSASNLADDEPTQPLPSDSLLRSNASISRVSESIDMGRSLPSFGGAENKGDTIFASCCLYAFGFPPRQTDVLVNTVSSLGGLVVGSLADVSASEGMIRRFVIVPQSADQKSLPLLPDGVDLITECFIERCLHRRALLDPKDHVIGRPFPVFPIEGFDKLSICTAGFTDVDLLQVDKSIRQLGARFEERFNAGSSLLLCASLGAVRKQKLDLALLWNVPVIKAEWLWACISQGKRLSTKSFLFPELKARITTEKVAISKPLNRSKSTSDMSRKLTPKSLPERTEKPGRASLSGPDMSAFDPTPLVSTDPPVRRPRTSSRHESNAATEFETAPTHQSLDKPTSRPSSRNGPRPLGEKSASELNKASAKDTPLSPQRKPLARVRSEVCDSEAGDDEGLDTTNDDGGATFETATAGPEREADAAELEKRRLERERAEKAEAERLALSSKLTSLLGGAPANNPSAAAANSDTTASGAGTGASREDAAVARPGSRRKKRDVIGRAISNVSAASTGSAESSAAAAAVVVGLVGRSAAVIHHHEEEVEGSDGLSQQCVPTATQVLYDDPEATISKERLMSKMLGRGGGGSGAPAGADRGAVGASSNNKVRPAPAASGRAAGGRSMRPR